MNSKAIYWIALGAFALGLNSEYRSGNLPGLHRVANRAEAVFCQVASRAEQTLAMARVLTGPPRPEFRVDDEFLARQQAEVDRVIAEHQAELDRAMALRQADFDRVQERLDRMHMVLDRTRLQKVRVLERSRFKLSTTANRRVMVICPKTGAEISVDAVPDMVDVDVEVPEVHVERSF